jgi:hypothetical protein
VDVALNQVDKMSMLMEGDKMTSLILCHGKFSSVEKFLTQTPDEYRPRLYPSGNRN